jgi:hypothetical protein
VITEVRICLGTVLDAAKPSTLIQQLLEKYAKQPVEHTNRPSPPSPSGKRAPILSDMALLFVRLHLDSRRIMGLGRQMDSRKHKKQRTN